MLSDMFRCSIVRAEDYDSIKIGIITRLPHDLYIKYTSWGSTK